MRIQAKDLKQQLTQKLAPIYVIFGGEPYQSLSSIQLIRNMATKQNFSEYIHFDISLQFNWENLTTEIHSPSLFGNKKIIACDIVEDKISKKGSETLLAFANKCPSDILLLLIFGKLDNNILQSTWFTKLEQQGISVQARNLYKEEVLLWLSEQLRSVNLHAERDVLHLLYERSEGNLPAAAQCIEKLQLYYAITQNQLQQQDITLENVMQILSDSTHFTTFDLVDALLEGSFTRTNRILQSLKSEGVEPILILWSITREMRTISHFCYDLIRGVPLMKTIENARLWKRKQSLIHQYFTRCTLTYTELQQQLYQNLIQAKQIDDIIKGRQVGEVWHELASLCYKMIQFSGARNA